MWRKLTNAKWLLAVLMAYSTQGLADMAFITNPEEGVNFKMDGTYNPGTQSSVTKQVDATTISGTVNCGAIKGAYLYHGIFIDLPVDAASGRYRVNDNITMYVLSNPRNGYTVPIDYWRGATNTSACSNKEPNTLIDASSFNGVFPITLTLYVEKVPADNIIVMPDVVLGGYSRRVETMYPDPGAARPTRYTIPFHLRGGAIKVDTPSCTTSETTNTLEINHGIVPSNTSSHQATAKITYTCQKKINATFTISHTKNAKGQLDLIDSDGVVAAQSDLNIKDGLTGDIGKTLKSTIETGASRDFTVSSTLSDITREGEIHGSAWLIATID